MSNLRKLTRCMDEFRKVNTNAEVTANMVMAFLIIAERQETTISELANSTGLTHSTVSRIIAKLGKYGNRGTEPLHLVIISDNLLDRREKQVTLSPKGNLLRNSLEDILE